ncbi:major facilitator superfamily MFS_1 [Methylobacterium sp. 4-46]|uniref:MFS transporter n=1 Tax=unclassified Methylobacterium TaxID=2615210 RepID=UPI000165CBB8|nr:MULTISPECIES: MFS transporter [Methylobacterium]ACA20873.1 major facilitator superfamily MFS_1 [Methylobacterium sp. 4-46]WFT80028.1 MFS transporter [Methylobacterium nodulans]
MTAARRSQRRAAGHREVPRYEPRPEAGREPARAPSPAPLPATRREKHAPSAASARGLDAFTFFVANLQTGFGPFVAVHFTAHQWTQADIGLVLTIGGLFSLLGQVPGGGFVDWVRSKRAVAALAVGVIGASAAGLGLYPTFLVAALAMAAHSLASCVLTPAIAAISLGLSGHARLGERLGRNARFSSIGNALAAAGMGACGYYLSNAAVFYVTAALVVPTLVALSTIRAGEIEVVRPQGRDGAPPPSGWAGLRLLLTNRALLCFGACILLFYVANAAMLPLVGSVLTMRASQTATILIAACIMAPQIVLALIAPAVGRAAQTYGRRPLLVLGFAALPLRGILFAYAQEPEVLVLIQVLDGVSAAVIGVMVPLVVADVTRGTGRFNLALGAVGTGMGIGAALSTTLSGAMADHLGTHAAFLGLAGVAVLALLLLLLVMPETRRGRGA